METYTAHYKTDAEYALHEIEAETPEHALQLARQLWETDPHRLAFEKYDMAMPLDEIEIEGDEGSELATWHSDDMRLRLAAQDLFDVLEAQTDAAQAVIDAWCKGDLAGAVRALDGAIPAARASIAKAKGGAP